MSIDWWNTLIIGLLVLGGAGVYGIWRAARMVRAWRRAGRLVDNLADIDAYSDELEPLPDEWDDQTLAELREPSTDLPGRGEATASVGDLVTPAGELHPEQERLPGPIPHFHKISGDLPCWCAAPENERPPLLLPPEHDERLPEMLYADGLPVFASLLESAAWDAHWEQAWGELQRARESAWEWYRAPERCWAGVATGTFPAVTG
jgi:hypothetical protein